MEQPRRYYRRGGFAWPLILIALGAIFLLSNLGVLNWNVWDLILRLWPVLLIAIGLDILLGRRSALGSLVVLILVIALIGGLIWYAINQSPVVTGQVLTTNQVVQELADATSADVQINVGAGALRIGALKDSGNLIEGTIATGPGETIMRDFRMDGGVARLQLKTQGVSIAPCGFRRCDQSWNLDLSSSVPMALHVSTGVGQSTLDLSGLRVTNLDVNTGVGQTVLKLPASGQLSAKVSGGIGQVIVTIPEGAAARIHATRGLGGLSVSNRFILQGNGYYVSGDYFTADNRVDLQVSGGIGEVVVR